MSNLKHRTKSRIVVNIIDLSGEEKKAFDYMQAKEFREDLAAVTVTYSWGYVETPNGIYLICSEGVGEREPVSRENPAKFYFNREFKQPNGMKSLEICSCVGVSMNDEDLLQLPVKAGMTLDKFIRVYNSRLEANYESWQDFLSREMERPKTCTTREVVEQKKEEEEFQKSEISELLT